MSGATDVEADFATCWGADALKAQDHEVAQFSWATRERPWSPSDIQNLEAAPPDRARWRRAPCSVMTGDTQSSSVRPEEWADDSALYGDGAELDGTWGGIGAAAVADSFPECLQTFTDSAAIAADADTVSRSTTTTTMAACTSAADPAATTVAAAHSPGPPPQPDPGAPNAIPTPFRGPRRHHRQLDITRFVTGSGGNGGGGGSAGPAAQEEPDAPAAKRRRRRRHAGKQVIRGPSPVPAAPADDAGNAADDGGGRRRRHRPGSRPPLGTEHVNCLLRLDMNALRAKKPAVYEHLECLLTRVTDAAMLLMQQQQQQPGGGGGDNGIRRQFAWKDLRDVFGPEVEAMAAAADVPPDQVRHWIMARVRQNLRQPSWRRAGARPVANGRGKTPQLSYVYLGQMALAFVETYFGGIAEHDRQARKSVRRIALSMLEHAGSVFVHLLFLLCETVHAHVHAGAVARGDEPPPHPTAADLDALCARFGGALLAGAGAAGPPGGAAAGTAAAEAAATAAALSSLPALADLVGLLEADDDGATAASAEEAQSVTALFAALMAEVGQQPTPPSDLPPVCTPGLDGLQAVCAPVGRPPSDDGTQDYLAAGQEEEEVEIVLMSGGGGGNIAAQKNVAEAVGAVPRALGGSCLSPAPV